VETLTTFRINAKLSQAGADNLVDFAFPIGANGDKLSLPNGPNSFQKGPFQ